MHPPVAHEVETTVKALSKLKYSHSQIIKNLKSENISILGALYQI